MGAPEGVLLKPEPLSYPFIDLASSKANLRRTERARGLRGYSGRLTEQSLPVLLARESTRVRAALETFVCIDPIY